MSSNGFWTRLRLRLSPTLFHVTFMLLSLAIVAAKFQPVLSMSERWG
jgi:hypothetical protein